jgi:hypothetical protein
MPARPSPRPGEKLAIKNRDLAFSFFPVRFRRKGYTLSDTVFAVSPWAVMQGAVDERLDGERHVEASAFLAQAHDFYVTASERLAANPLLFYYAFLNLGKAVLRVRGLYASLDRAHHGLIEEPDAAESAAVEGAAVCVRHRDGRVHVFPELFGLIESHTLEHKERLGVGELLGDVVVGHRQWRDAADADERFIPLEDIALLHDRSNKTIWLACSSTSRTSTALTSPPVR